MLFVRDVLVNEKLRKMKKFMLLLLLAFGFNLGVNAQAANSKGVVAIPAEKFKKMAESGRYTIIDIRTPREFAEGHIKGAINIDFYKKTFYSKMDAYKNKAFLYYCRSGNRTGQAMRKFNQMNFKEGYDLQHGIISWKRAGFKFVK